MIQLERIMVATDFSDHAQIAMRYAAALAQRFGSEIVVCHVIRPLSMSVLMPAEESAAGDETYPDRRASNAREAAEQLLNSFDVSKGRVLIESGTPFVKLVQVAKNEDIDLLVVGTHGVGAIAHFLLGSTAENVVRTAPCPVLVVRDGEHDFVSP